MQEADHTPPPERDMHPMTLTPGRKLQLFQTNDHSKQWWNLDELRFCVKCEHLFIGRDIRVLEDDDGNVHFRCPTLGCESTWEDWHYPDLHL